jgi:hypothetical protein
MSFSIEIIAKKIDLLEIHLLFFLVFQYMTRNLSLMYIILHLFCLNLRIFPTDLFEPKLQWKKKRIFRKIFFFLKDGIKKILRL